MLSPDKVSSPSEMLWANDNDHEPVDFDRLLSVVRRQWRLVAACVFVAVVLGIVFAVTAVPRFTALTNVIIDRGNSGIITQLTDSPAGGVTVDDEANVLSQLEIIKSDTIALEVVRKLNLAEDPIFMASESSLLGTIRSFLNFKSWFAEKGPGVDKEIIAKNTLLGNLWTARVGRSYVISISYTSTSPELAARIADAVADAYLVDKLNAKYDATRRASDWLQERIDDLKRKVLESDLAVQKFRSEHGLFATSNGSLMSDQQLAELNSALIVAQSETARAQAKYDRIASIVANKQTDALVTDVLGNTISNELRQKYLSAAKMEAEITARLGPDHIQAVRLRGEMEQYKQQMFQELSRIAESYQSELQVAQTREKSLRDSVEQASRQVGTANETQVQLRELERSADSYKNLYQTFLAKFQEATQQQSFPITEARVITKASVPLKPSSPKKPLVVALAMFMGLAVGGGLGAYREFRDRFFRTGDQIRQNLNLEYLGLAPLIDNPGTPAETEYSDRPNVIRPISNLSRYVVDHPLSSFAETVRSAKIAIDLGAPDKRSKVIGVVSTLPGEGKSTVSINFAELLAMQGARVLLIDADLRNPGATRAIARHAEKGLLEALFENAQMKDLLLLDPQTRLAFLPAVTRRRVPHSAELLASNSMVSLLDKAKEHFDYIILDLPPLGPVVDARAISPLLTNVVMVVEWGRTSRKVVRSTLANEPELHEKCAGVILNKVDTEKMKLYRSFGSNEYYFSRYSAYYHES